MWYVCTLHISTIYTHEHFVGFQCLMCYGWWILWDSVGQKGSTKTLRIFFLIAEYSLLHIRLYDGLILYDDHKTWVMRKEIITINNTMHVYM